MKSQYCIRLSDEAKSLVRQLMSHYGSQEAYRRITATEIFERAVRHLAATDLVIPKGKGK